MNQKNKRTILIVDDQPNWRDLLQTLLRREFAVTTAASYTEALNIMLAQDPPFHVVITDLRLVDERRDNEDGLLLTEHLNRLGDKTRVIVITGYPSIASAKRAIGRLEAFDYLEKRPAGGVFDRAEFLKVVREAAEEAEKQRPRAFSRRGQRLLVIEENQRWRSELLNILRRDGYDVDELPSIQGLEERMQQMDRPYNLVLFNQDFANDAFFTLLQRLNPQARVVMLSAQDYGEILYHLQERGVLGVVTIQEGSFKPQVLREVVRRAFAPDATKYIVTHLRDLSQPEGETAEPEMLQPGKTYQLTLTLQDAQASNATAIWLAPRADKRGRITLEVFTRAEQIELHTAASQAYWEIPPSGRPLPFILEFSPRPAAYARIIVDLEQDYRSLGRIERKFQVFEAQA